MPSAEQNVEEDCKGKTWHGSVGVADVLNPLLAMVGREPNRKLAVFILGLTLDAVAGPKWQKYGVCNSHSQGRNGA